MLLFFQSITFILLLIGQTFIQLLAPSQLKYIPEIGGVIFLVFWIISIAYLYFVTTENTNKRFFLIFLFLASFGKMLHIVSNYIHNENTFSLTNSFSYMMWSFLDEGVSHYLALIAYTGIVVLFLTSKKIKQKINTLVSIVLGTVSGVALWMFIIESQTVLIFVAIMLLFLKYLYFKRSVPLDKINIYFLTQFISALLLIIIYGLIMKGLPEFSAFGLL